ncbi:MAG: hypothetical protein MI976_20110 [Pseudomonadales bacterium]|nr:hypothetical protein [Pseudomonadales bacterium]
MSDITRQSIMNSLDQLKNDDKKISIKSVADAAGISHSLIYNRYPELKLAIKNAQREQASYREKKLSEKKIESLQVKVRKLEEKSNQKVEQEQQSFPELLANLQQVYSMYDQVLEERNEFARQLAAVQNARSK